MLVLSKFEIKILFRNFKHKPDYVKKRQYRHYQEKMSRKEWLQLSCLQGSFLRKSMGRELRGFWEAGFTTITASSVVQVLEGQQKYHQREWAALYFCCLAHHGLPAVIRVGESRTLL